MTRGDSTAVCVCVCAVHHVVAQDTPTSGPPAMSMSVRLLTISPASSRGSLPI